MKKMPILLGLLVLAGVGFLFLRNNRSAAPVPATVDEKRLEEASRLEHEAGQDLHYIRPPDELTGYGPAPKSRRASPLPAPAVDRSDLVRSSSGTPSAPLPVAVAMSGAEDVVERYPNIEAPDTVSLGHEIAVQISLTAEQIAPETKIVSGEAKDGRLQLHLEGAESWTLTVNVSAPGLELARGGSNTVDIKINRAADSEIAVFYMKPKESATMPAQRDTQILASLWHGSAFLARISRPITIVAGDASAVAGSKPVAAPVVHPAAAPVAMDTALVEPDLTIVESRFGDDLRLTFRSRNATFEADIADPAALHAWIDQHYAQMARHPRGMGARAGADASANLRGQDYLEGFGNDLFDKYAPQEFKQMLAASELHSIQVLSDDPAIPWELMRPLAADGKARAGFLGADHVIARWPLTQHGTARPPQVLAVSAAVVIAPKYAGGNNLDSAGEESAMLTKTYRFTAVDGTYAAVREVAKNPPQGIVHFAGHGGVDVQDGVPNFVILLEGDASIAPATWTSLESPTNANHTFYFFNACDVGESQKFMNGVDGWAPALLARGATGYIGALWPISDDTAKLFAQTFYALLGKAGVGAMLGGVFMQTRETVYEQTHDVTALAYVFYGDPMLRMMAK